MQYAEERAMSIWHVYGTTTIRCVAALLLPDVERLRFEPGKPFDVFALPVAAPQYACRRCRAPVFEKWEETRHACEWGARKRARVSETEGLGRRWVRVSAAEAARAGAAESPATGAPGALEALGRRLAGAAGGAQRNACRLSIQEWRDFGITDLQAHHVIRCADGAFYRPAPVTSQCRLRVV
jgi:hypothetical protein